eukprot:8787424-Ditylum_brightwellii.AAC.1
MNTTPQPPDIRGSRELGVSLNKSEMVHTTGGKRKLPLLATIASSIVIVVESWWWVLLCRGVVVSQEKVG